MFRIYIILLMICFMPSIVMAQVTCPQQPLGDIIVSWGSETIKYDFSKSQTQMDAIENDTINPYDSHIESHVGGLMQGGIEISTEIITTPLALPRARKGCFWVGSVTVKLTIEPKILIARQYKPGSCRHNAILEHEMKHIFVDRAIARKYVSIFKDEIKKHAMAVGIVGPKDYKDADLYQNKIIEYMNDKIKLIREQMEKDRLIAQRKIDTLKEYERVAAMCR